MKRSHLSLFQSQEGSPASTLRLQFRAKKIKKNRQIVELAGFFSFKLQMNGFSYRVNEGKLFCFCLFESDQGLLEFIWTEGCSDQSSNPGRALAILVL